MMHPSNRRVRASIPPEAPEGNDVACLDEAEVAASAPPKKAPRSARAERVASSLRFLSGLALVLATSWGVAWAARQYVMTSPRFAVADIVVQGNKHRTAQQLADEAGIVKGKNVFAVDLEEGRAALQRDPWVKEVTVARRLPGTLLISVTEREAAAMVALGETYLASRDGEVFKRFESGDPSDLPVITGITSDAVAGDREGVERSIRRALDLAVDYQATSLAEKAPLQEIHLATDGTTTLVVGRPAFQLALGEPPFRRKLEQAERVYAELVKRGAKADAILLDNDARPERVVVRMR